MKYYVIHYTKNVPLRARLTAQLEKLNITAEWIESYDCEDPVIANIKLITGTKLSLKYISCNMKHYVAMQKMVDENIPEAVILEDDVVFFPEFQNVHPYHASGLLRLGLGVGAGESHRPPRSSTSIYVTSNPGGSEATWICKKFAEVATKNINFDNTIDMVQNAILIQFFREKMRCMNTCYQTSLDYTTPPVPTDDWKIFCENFLDYKRYDFKTLMASTRVNHPHGDES